MKGVLALLLAVTAASSAQDVLLGPDSWVVLVAGAVGWENYGIQADILHTYHTVLAKGVRKDRIITLMFDDIVNDENNPHKGTVINKPGGPDVYRGVNIDYRSEEVTVKNFFNVLLGKEKEMQNTGTGRVLKSGPKDTVFIYYVDHGGPGLIMFPYEELYAKDFIQTIHQMKDSNLFNKLVIFVTACFSGSMFDNLIEHVDNVFVTTAAATDEPGYFWYCNDTTYHTCLATEFSAMWTEKIDRMNNSESLFYNYDYLRTSVAAPEEMHSHVQIYGDYKLGFLQEFGSTKTTVGSQTQIQTQIPKTGRVEVGEMPLHMAMKAAQDTEDPDYQVKQEHVRKMLRGRTFAGKLMSRILEVFTEGNTNLQKDLETNRYTLNLGMFDCYKNLVKTFGDHCFNIHQNTYFLKLLHKFSNICVKQLDEEKAVNAIKSVCDERREQINSLDIFVQ